MKLVINFFFKIIVYTPLYYFHFSCRRSEKKIRRIFLRVISQIREWYRIFDPSWNPRLVMRIKRYKKAYKCLSFYINNFGFHKPFQLLIDGTFCFAALQVSLPHTWTKNAPLSNLYVGSISIVISRVVFKSKRIFQNIWEVKSNF